MSLKERRFTLLLFPLLLLVCCENRIVRAQDKKEDVIRVHTRVVFIDALVKDKRTGAPVSCLTRDDFQVLDNGKLRPLDYFGDANHRRERPLVLLLGFDVAPGGAGRYLRRPEVIQSLIAAVAKLPPEDEVGVMIIENGATWNSPASLAPTRDRAKLAAALSKLPDEITPNTVPAADTMLIEDAVPSIAARRPNSQTALILVTNAVYPLIYFSDVTDLKPDRMMSKLVEANVSVSSLVNKMDKFFVFLYPLFKAGESLGEMKFYGVPQYFARETGGDVVQVRKAEEYGAGLERLVGTLAARYSLGFTLDENERDDGHQHKLEIKVKAQRDIKDKERKLTISARRGYYTPKK